MTRPGLPIPLGLEDQVKAAILSLNPAAVNDVLSLYESLPNRSRNATSLRQITMKMRSSGVLPTMEEMQMSTDRTNAFKRLREAGRGGLGRGTISLRGGRGRGRSRMVAERVGTFRSSASDGHQNKRAKRQPHREELSQAARPGHSDEKVGDSDQPRNNHDNSSDLLRVFPSLRGRGGLHGKRS